MYRKRIEIWQTYRKQIFDDSMNIVNPLNSNGRWNSYIKQINSINPSIIKSIKFDELIQLPFIFKINDQLDTKYKQLNFSIDSINESLINDFKYKNEWIHNQNEKCVFFNGNDNTLNSEYIKDMLVLETSKMQMIDIKIKELETNIQSFSTNAKERLKSLNATVNEAKRFKNDSLVDLKFAPKNNSFNFKITYFIILISLIVVAVILVVLMIYFLLV